LLKAVLVIAEATFSCL